MNHAYIILAIHLLALLFYLSLRWVLGNRIGLKSALLFFLGLNIFILSFYGHRYHYPDILIAFAWFLALIWLWVLCAAFIFFIRFFIKSKQHLLLRSALPVLFLGLSAFTYYQGHVPILIRQEIKLPGHFEPKKIAFISDTHFSKQVGLAEIERIKHLINPEQVDLILIAGDVINDDPTPFIQEKMGEALQNIQSRYGIFAILGNHEYYGSLSANIQAIRQAGIHLLIDQEMDIGEDIHLIGRDDYSNKSRKKIEAFSFPEHKINLVMDHQPRDLNQYAAHPMHLYLAGHTHLGQIFPLNLLIKRLYELPYGYRHQKQQHFIVSSGLGFWGAPFRLGSRSEIWLLEIKPE